MRKWIAAGAVVVVLAGAGYLGAQAYSSHRFESEMVKLVERLDANPQWQVSRADVDQGWFHSSGRFEARYVDPAGQIEPVTIETPYAANHGLLETTLSGESEVSLDDRRLFGDVLKGEAPIRWQGRFLTRDQRLESHVEVPSFTHEMTLPAQEIDGEVVGPRTLAFDVAGFSMDVTQVDDETTLEGRLPSLEMRDEATAIRVEDLTLAGQYSGDPQAFDQTFTLTLPTTTVTPVGNPSVITRNAHYTMQATLDEAQLALGLVADLGQTEVQEQPVFNGGLTLALDRVDGNAYREFAADLDAHLGRIQAAVDAEDEAALDAAMAPIRPQLQAILAGSPRLTLDALTLDSDVLGMKMNGNGELTLDNDGIADWDLDTMSEQAIANGLIKRLKGHLTLNGAPPMLALYLGLPMTSDPLRLKLAGGVLNVNGQQMPLVMPAPASAE